jgi:hypothetical protein
MKNLIQFCARRSRRVSAAFLLLLLPAARLSAAPSFTWPVPSNRIFAASAQAWRGETLELNPQWPAATNGLAFAMYWQTNGMGSAWWSDATNAFTWTPAKDCGADAYRIFIQASDAASSISWRANLSLRILPSPGASPNVLPLPAQTIDFSQIEVLNAPWLDALAADDIYIRRDGSSLTREGAWLTSLADSSTNGGFAIRLSGASLFPALRLSYDRLERIEGPATNLWTFGAGASTDLARLSDIAAEAYIRTSAIEDEAIARDNADSLLSSRFYGYLPLSGGVVRGNVRIIGTNDSNVIIANFKSMENNDCSGRGSVAFGGVTKATGQYSFAQGGGSVASDFACVALGYCANATHFQSFVWNGTERSDIGMSMGNGTFNLYPIGNFAGFYVGGTSLDSWMTESLAPIGSRLDTLEAQVPSGAIGAQTNALSWSADAQRIAVSSGATLAAVTNGWPDGQAMLAIIDCPASYSVSGIALSGYGTWQTNCIMQAVAWRVGTNIWTSIIQSEAK